MTKSIGEAVAYTDELTQRSLPEGVQTFVLPALTSLSAVRDRLPVDSRLLLGVQNAHYEAEGPHTGEVSMAMVRDAGASIVEIGHSERRLHQGETDEIVAAKVRAAVDHGLTPLICVGESERVRSAGGALDFVRGQLFAAMARLDPEEWDRTLVAYEPVWAIGAAGTPATAEQIAPVLAAINDATHGCASVLYGGSVDASVARKLRGVAQLDGLFVGRSAWTASGLRELIDIWAQRSSVETSPTLISEQVR